LYFFLREVQNKIPLKNLLAKEKRPILMVIHMMATIKMAKEMVKVTTNGQQKEKMLLIDTKALGKIILRKESENWHIQTENLIMENGKAEENMEMDYIPILIKMYIQDNGRMEKKHG